ncbi:Release factor glutamine methyltransferase [termite gut metagenome]|uniref:peptide chain release factor N(5)-glutamine methyltransferase n=1 Tax=termite gut metagenome TaxID=433724 RepID=A0A5J4R9G4_9ZZZZ
MNRITSYIRQSLDGIYPPEEVKSLTLIICRDMLRLAVTDIYLNREIILSEDKWKELERIIERLQQHEPIQYIRGNTDFFGMNFRIAPGVLIPRPETEELVALIIKENRGILRILDIGTGSGCIAISLAKHIPQITVSAWDISEEALTIAQENNKRLGTNVTFYNKDVLNTSSCEEEYDVIVSNPPYVTEAERGRMEARVTDWEPGIALFVPNNDPLRFYRHIARLGKELLLAKGKLYFEINQAYGEEASRMLNESGYRNVRVIKDLFGKDRIVTAER